MGSGDGGGLGGSGRGVVVLWGWGRGGGGGGSMGRGVPYYIIYIYYTLRKIAPRSLSLVVSYSLQGLHPQIPWKSNQFQVSLKSPSGLVQGRKNWLAGLDIGRSLLGVSRAKGNQPRGAPCCTLTFI